MMPVLKTLNLIQTLLFIAALAWFVFVAPDISGDMVLTVIVVFVLWLIFIALVGKALYDAERKEQKKKAPLQKLSVYEFIWRSQQEGSNRHSQ